MSAQCVQIDSSNFLVASYIPLDQCTSYVLLDAADWGGSSIWAVPAVADVSAIWALAFSLPLIVYLMAWSCGVVINMFKRS